MRFLAGKPGPSTAPILIWFFGHFVRLFLFWFAFAFWFFLPFIFYCRFFGFCACFDFYHLGGLVGCLDSPVVFICSWRAWPTKKKVFFCLAFLFLCQSNFRAQEHKTKKVRHKIKNKKQKSKCPQKSTERSRRSNLLGLHSSPKSVDVESRKQNLFTFWAVFGS